MSNSMSRFMQQAEIVKEKIAAAQTGNIFAIPTSNISPSPFQTRRYFDEDGHQQLVQSIKECGLIQPILVRLNPKGGTDYELIAGERRLRANTDAGFNEIACYLVAVDDKMARRMCIFENGIRLDISVLEKTAGVVDFLMDSLNLSDISEVIQKFKSLRSTTQIDPVEDAAILEAVGLFFPRMKPSSFAANRLPLLSIEKEVIITALLKSEIDPSYALLLDKVDEKDVPDLIVRIREGSLTIQTLREQLPIEKRKSSKNKIEEKDKEPNQDLGDLSGRNDSQELGENTNFSTKKNVVKSQTVEKGEPKATGEAIVPVPMGKVIPSSLSDLLIEILSASANFQWKPGAKAQEFNSLIQKAISLVEDDSTRQ
jgi:ParB family transcriptional regulator, chromosome partitioning protein